MSIIKLFKGLIHHFKKEKRPTKKTIQPVIIPRSEHTISRNVISPNALKVLYRLHNANYSAYLVGGCVRDLLLGFRPKDFDIATSARPEEVRQLFKNSRLIGKRFRLAHIVFGKEIIEVATFRTHHHENANEKDARMVKGMIVRDNVYGDIEDDATRRDFTINSLYYNIADFSVVDYTKGMDDLKHKQLRMIGDPEKRYHEDPVRLLRAIRFAGKLSLIISPETEEPILRLSYLLQQVSPARLFQEVLKFFREGASLATFKLLQKYHLFAQLFPETQHALHQQDTFHFIEKALHDADLRLKQDKTISPAFLFSVFLWRPIVQASKKAEDAGHPPYVAFEKSIRTVLHAQHARLTIPRLMTQLIREICLLQLQFTYRHDSKPYRLLSHPRFRAAYDLLLLRAECGEPIRELADWWIQFYSNEHAREEMVKTISKEHIHKKSRRKNRRRNRFRNHSVLNNSEPESNI